jgi:hypothetical protein
MLAVATEECEPQPSTSGNVAHDHIYFTRDSPRKLKRLAANIVDQLDICQKKLQVKQQQVRRLGQKVDILRDVVTELQSKKSCI